MKLFAPRTREAILAEVTVKGGYVWEECHNCGGTGRYPSSCIPAGQCRFYCWKGRTAETYGKLPTEIERYVRAQLRRDKRAWIALNPSPEVIAKREAEARLVAEREAYREDADRTRKAQWAAEKAAAPAWVAGRQVIEGRVLKGEWRSSGPAWASKSTFKATVKLDDARVIWTSLPRGVEQGQRVRVKITVEPTAEHNFAFGKRPAEFEVIA